MCEHSSRRTLKPDLVLSSAAKERAMSCRTRESGCLPDYFSQSSYTWLGSSVVAVIALLVTTFPEMSLMYAKFNCKAFLVFVYTFAGSCATGLGCVPLMMLKNIDGYVHGVSAAIASGLMATASIELVREGISCRVNYGAHLCALGAGLGVLLVMLTDYVVDNLKITIGDLKGADARRAVVVIGVMTLHSFAEGVGVGVSFSGEAGDQLGRFIAIAIGLHNIPEGMAIGLTMVPQGESVLHATAFSVMSSLPQPLVSVPAFLLVEQFQIFLPVGLGMAAGAMFWLVISELLPDALEHISLLRTAPIFLSSMGAMFVIGFFLHQLELVAVE